MAEVRKSGANELAVDILSLSDQRRGQLRRALVRHGLELSERVQAPTSDARCRQVALAGDAAGLERMRDRYPGHLLACWRQPGAPVAGLEAQGAHFFLEDAEQAVAFLVQRRLSESLSLVLLAYNEEQSIARAIEDGRRFGELFFAEHEIIVVDDGSRDGTSAIAEGCGPVSPLGRDRSGPGVRVIRHERNRGMGAALKAGFLAARMDVVAPLPADRQVRPASLIGFLPLLDERTIVVGYYEQPHAGGARRVLSAGFRHGVKRLAGLSVPFDGSYLFFRRALEAVDWRCAASSTFVFSYELLEQFRRAGWQFEHRVVWPVRREAGTSRVANPRRIARVLREILASRRRSLQATFADAMSGVR